MIAAVAVAEAGVSLVTRWLSSLIGEGLILDLRTAVFDHVQKMPVAFFTRTRTGALVSRLGNDVMGAQRAFSDTFSGVITNVVTLTLTMVVMLRISWQVTLLSLLLMPLFLLPARWIGRTMARLSREAAAHNATMNTQMTERFSAPGATLVKLFGSPATESREFEVRADRVRDIGVRTAMLQSVFMNSLTLMSALALALVYGLGGVLAIGGHLQTGAIVALALLLTRLYSPLTALANAHVEIASALVSFERVFEVLDLEPLIQEKPAAAPVPEGAVSVEFDDVRFSYPSADKVSLASLEEVAVLSENDVRGGEEVLHGISFTAQPGEMVALVGSSGAGKSTIASLMARLYDVDSGAVRLNGTDVRDVSFASLKETVGMVTQDGHLFHETIASNLRLAAPDATDDELWQALERARLGRCRRPDARRSRHRGRGARLPALRRSAPAADDRTAAARPLPGGGARRGDRIAGLRVGGRGAAGARRGARGPDLDRDRPPAVHGARGRHDPGRRGRPHRRTRQPRPAAGPRRALRRAVRDPVRHAGAGRRCRSGVRVCKHCLIICRLADNWNYFD